MELQKYDCNASVSGDPLFHLKSKAGWHDTETILEFYECLYQDGKHPTIINQTNQHNLIFTL